MECTLINRGPGIATVFIHGFLQSAAFWEPQFNRLAAAGRYCLAPDLPGFGASAKQAGPYTTAGLADAVVRFLDDQGIETCTIVGGSMGGVVAQQLCLRHPQRVARLMLVATGAYFENPPAGRAMVDELAKGEWNEGAIKPFVQGFFHHRPVGAAWTKFVDIALSASRSAAIEAGRSNADSNTADRLSSIKVPTMIIQGRQDRGRTPEHGTMMMGKISGAELSVVEDAGHTPQLDQPEAFNAVAFPFLTAV